MQKQSIVIFRHFSSFFVIFRHFGSFWGHSSLIGVLFFFTHYLATDKSKNISRLCVLNDTQCENNLSSFFRHFSSFFVIFGYLAFHCLNIMGQIFQLFIWEIWTKQHIFRGLCPFLTLRRGVNDLIRIFRHFARFRIIFICDRVMLGISLTNTSSIINKTGLNFFLTPLFKTERFLTPHNWVMGTNRIEDYSSRKNKNGGNRNNQFRTNLISFL